MQQLQPLIPRTHRKEARLVRVLTAENVFRVYRLDLNQLELQSLSKLWARRIVLVSGCWRYCFAVENIWRYSADVENIVVSRYVAIFMKTSNMIVVDCWTTNVKSTSPGRLCTLPQGKGIALLFVSSPHILQIEILHLSLCEKCQMFWGALIESSHNISNSIPTGLW